MLVDINCWQLIGIKLPAGTFLNVTAVVPPQGITATSPDTPTNNAVGCVNFVTSEGVAALYSLACSTIGIISNFVPYYLIELFIFAKIQNKMKVLTVITSYNRKKSLLNLLQKLEKQPTDVVIYDDNSDFKLNIPQFKQFKHNYGKEYLWLKFKKIFNELPKSYDYYIILPDDIDISNNFVKSAVNSWENLTDKEKICLSLLTDGRINKPNWTAFKPLIKSNYVQTQWQDFCFICEKEFFTVDIQQISLQRWQVIGKSLNIELGSGLGGQISRYWNDKGRTMYHTKKSLVKHLKGVSKMNPHERLINPLND